MNEKLENVKTERQKQNILQYHAAERANSQMIENQLKVAQARVDCLQRKRKMANNEVAKVKQMFESNNYVKRLMKTQDILSKDHDLQAKRELVKLRRQES